MQDVEDHPDTEDGARLYTPMLEAAFGLRLALFRDRHGARCAVGFRTPEALERVLGPGYTVLPLARRVVRELAAARGADEILIDPAFAAAPITHEAQRERRMNPQTAGALAVCAAAGAAAALLGEFR